MYLHFHAYPVPLDLLDDARCDPGSFLGTDDLSTGGSAGTNPLQLGLGTTWELLRWLFELSIEDLLGPGLRRGTTLRPSLPRRLLARLRPAPALPPAPKRPALQLVDGIPQPCAHGWVPSTQVFSPIEVAAIAADLALWTQDAVENSCGTGSGWLDEIPPIGENSDLDHPFEENFHAARLIWARLQAAQNYTTNLSMHGLGMLRVIG